MRKESISIDRMGERHTTNEGYNIEIIEYHSSENCTIIFDNKIILKERHYSQIKRGNIKNPYHLSVLGVGYLGIGKYGVCKKSEFCDNFIYEAWHSMLSRCYSNKNQQKQPTYQGCSVDKIWHNFQNFAKWYEENYKSHMKGWQLDKDILQKGNKIYSPETCCFVPSKINNIFLKSDKSRGEFPIGVSYSKKRNKYLARININGKNKHLGEYKTPEEAFQAYKTAKEAYIKEVADKWKDKITEECYKALITYKIKITD